MTLAGSKPDGNPTHEEIEQRAYEIYVERGGADGSDLQDWLQAELELLEKRGKIGFVRATSA